MRWVSTAVLAIGVCCAATGAEQNEPAAEVRAILDRAMDAMGGKEKLAAVKAISGQGTATYYGELVPLQCKVSGAVQFPDQKRLSLDVGIDGLRAVYTEVLNGKQGWIDARGRTSPLNADQMAEMRADVYLNWLTTLVPLRNREFRLTGLGEVRVNGRPAQGIQVRREGRPDVKLYFDRENGLLVKAEAAVSANLLQDYLYSDYKDYQGVQRAARQTVRRNGKDFLDVKFSEVEINPALGADTFAKP